MQFNSHFVESMSKLANITYWEEFNKEVPVYPMLFDVKHKDELGGLSYGQETEVIGRPEPKQIGYAQDHNFQDTKEGYIAMWALRLFQDGFQVTQDMLDNWQNNPKLAEAFVRKNAAEMGEAFASGRDRLAANVFNKGPLTAGDLNVFNGSKEDVQTDSNAGLIYDGLPFFDTAHTLNLDTATTFSNHSAVLALTEANLETVLTTMMVTNAKNERNLEIEVKPDVIVINPTQLWTAQKIIKSAQLPGSANNDINPMQGLLDIVPWAKITDTDAFFVGVRKKGIRLVHNGEPEMYQEMNKLRGKGVLSFSVTDEYAVYVRQWRYWYAANIAAA